MRRKEACLVSGHPGKSKNGVFLSAPCYQEVTVKMADKTRRLYLRRVAPFSRDVWCDFAAQYHRILPYLSVIFSRGMKRKIKFIHHTILCFFLNAPYVIFTVFQSKQKNGLLMPSTARISDEFRLCYSGRNAHRRHDK